MFQSTPPHGGRLVVANLDSCRERFNPRPRMGGDIPSLPDCPAKSGFNPRPRMGGDLNHGLKGYADKAVSIHAPAWGATCFRRQRHCNHSCFNPRPRMGGDRVPPALRAGTHGRFNPRPRMGGDVSVSCSSIGDTTFQSTPPHGGRPPYVSLFQAWIRVSIHAPAWGATAGSGGTGRGTRRFNPRPRMGGDEAARSAPSIYMGVSIHAPAWGATGDPSQIFWTQAVSIHAPAWGATSRVPFRVHRRPCFNPRPRMGGDRDVPM